MSSDDTGNTRLNEILGKPWWPLLVTFFAASGAWFTLQARVDSIAAGVQTYRQDMDRVNERISNFDIRFGLLDTRVLALAADDARNAKEAERENDRLRAQVTELERDHQELARTVAGLTATLHALRDRLNAPPTPPVPSVSGRLPGSAGR